MSPLTACCRCGGRGQCVDRGVRQHHRRGLGMELGKHPYGLHQLGRGTTWLESQLTIDLNRTYNITTNNNIDNYDKDFM